MNINDVVIKRYLTNILTLKEKREHMLNYLVGMSNTGDSSKPWLIAICMIVSIVVVVALFIVSGNKDREDDDDDE